MYYEGSLIKIKNARVVEANTKKGGILKQLVEDT